MKLLRPNWFDPAVVLVVLLVAFNLLAAIGAVIAGRDARDAIREGLELETRADARALEAQLASERARIEFLATTPALRQTDRPIDPVARRWARIDLEATLLRFIESGPAVARLTVRRPDQLPTVAERRSGIPMLATAEELTEPPTDWLRATWTLDDDGAELEAWIDPTPLLRDLGEPLTLHRSEPEAPLGPLEPIESAGWEPPLEAWLERSQGDARVLREVEQLASLYRGILILNVALLPATLLLGALTVRRVRRVARLQSERDQQARLRQLELQVQHAERLTSLGRFAAGTAHEINNPLGGMTNYLQLLRDDLADGRDEEARRWIDRLDEGIDRVSRIVRQVLDFAEPGSGELAEVDLRRVIEESAELARRHPESRNGEVTVTLDGDLQLRGDAVGLGQLTLNLMLNAFQAHGEHAAPQVEARASGRPEAVLLQVLDRGTGIPQELRDGQLFEPFRSGRDSTGLGLAVCHGIVTRHGGTIEAIDRQPGPGTEMRVVLPRRPPSPEDPAPNPPTGEQEPTP